MIKHVRPRSCRRTHDRPSDVPVPGLRSTHHCAGDAFTPFRRRKLEFPAGVEPAAGARTRHPADGNKWSRAVLEGCCAAPRHKEAAEHLPDRCCGQRAPTAWPVGWEKDDRAADLTRRPAVTGGMGCRVEGSIVAPNEAPEEPGASSLWWGGWGEQHCFSRSTRQTEQMPWLRSRGRAVFSWWWGSSGVVGSAGRPRRAKKALWQFQQYHVQPVLWVTT